MGNNLIMLITLFNCKVLGFSLGLSLLVLKLIFTPTSPTFNNDAEKTAHMHTFQKEWKGLQCRHAQRY